MLPQAVHGSVRIEARYFASRAGPRRYAGRLVWEIAAQDFALKPAAELVAGEQVHSFRV